MRNALLSLFAIVLSLAPLAAQEQWVKNGTENEKFVDGKFMFAAGSLAAATIFDAETTFTGIKNGAHEGNPLLKPFVRAGRPATYAALGGLDAGVLYAAYRMRKSPDPATRKLWWLGPVALTAVHAVSGGFNLRFTFH